MAVENKILILGPTGAIGRHIVWASVKAGNPTFALVRKSPGNVNKPKLITAANPESKEQLLESFQNSGVILLEGDINGHESLVKAIKQVDVVICAAGRLLIEDQVKIITAIKEAGNIKRFFPSEFGLDVDRHDSVEPVRQVFVEKASIRKIIESEGIPYTYLCCHAFTGYFLRNLAQLDATDPPRDKVVILGDGNVKDSSFPHNYLLALYHSQQIKGDAVYEIDPAKDVEASELYPDVKYTTADEYLNQFV